MNLSEEEMFKTVFLPILVVVLLTLGQIGFKIVGTSLGSLSIKTLVPLGFTLFIYAIATVLWIYVLSYMELSRAFSYYALVFVLVPTLGVFLFDETINHVKLIVGTILISGGVLIVNS